MSDEQELSVALPQTVQELDAFVTQITELFGLPPGDDTYEAIATMIMHLNHNIAYSKYSYFGHGVMKQIANRAAYEKLQEFAAKRKVKQEAEEKKAQLSLVSGETDLACGKESI